MLVILPLIMAKVVTDNSFNGEIHAVHDQLPNRNGAPKGSAVLAVTS
jgi:hypothetical protein